MKTTVSSRWETDWQARRGELVQNGVKNVLVDKGEKI